MPKILKIIALVLAALLALTIAVVGYLAATFDPNEYKPLAIRLVQEKKQRTLEIPGEIKLSFFPNIGADLGALTISERNSKEVFASVQSAQVSLALLPLLRGDLVVDRVSIDGLRATISRDRNGASNIDDLVGAEEDKQDSEQIHFDIAGVALTNAHLIYDDRQQQRKLEVRELDLNTGKIADRTLSELQLQAHVKSNAPQADARVSLKTGFTLDLAVKRYQLAGLEGELKGALAGITDAVIKLSGNADLQPAEKRFALDKLALNATGQRDKQPFELKLDAPQLAVTDAGVTGGKLAGELRLTQGARKINAAFRANAFEGTPQAFRVPALELDAGVVDAELDLQARLAGALQGDIDKMLFSSPQLSLNLSGKQGATPLKGTLTTPLSLDLNQQTLQLPKLGAEFTLPNPAGGTLALKAAGQAVVQLARETVNATLNGSLDQSQFNTRLAMNGFAKPSYNFDIGIDRLDADRYRKAEPPGQTAPAKEKGTGGRTGKGQADDQPLDLSALRDLRASGSLKIGALKVAGINASNVRVDLRAEGGKLELNPLAANLYGGAASGALGLHAASPARLALRQNLSGINVGPLLKDALDKDMLEGRGNVQLDVTASGATIAQMKRGLNGSARIELRDGAVRGINLAQTLRSAKSGIDALRGRESSNQAGTGSAGEKTDFSEMSGSFRIVSGVARNDDLEVKSPLLRVTGSGEIDLAGERLNYVARTTVVPTLQGQGGPELQALKGVTLPVRLEGPFSAIGWRVDVGAIATELARQKLEGKKEEAKARVQDEIKEQLRGLLRR